MGQEPIVLNKHRTKSWSVRHAACDLGARQETTDENRELGDSSETVSVNMIGRGLNTPA